MVAKDLLGKNLVRKLGKKVLIGKIVETEAYIGPHDKASHAFGGKVTPRNRAEYMVGGHVYIYLVYGMYWQLNISTGAEGKPECVLIRALEPIKNQKSKKLTNGPGKLCRWLKLDKSFYGEDVTKSKRLWLEDWGLKIKPKDIGVSPRIGIDYAGPIWSKKPWRFYLKNNPWVSKTQRK
jgi:DNA-3-methyladenine glycosylase